MTRRTSTAAELDAALDALVHSPDKIPAADWPPDDRNLNEAGLYSWWANTEGARVLSVRAGQQVAAGVIYVGQAGANRSSATLLERISKNHLGGHVRSSTLRRTLSGLLLNELSLNVVGPKKLDKESELRLTHWMRTYLDVTVHVFPHRYALKHLEDQVLAEIDPPLNIQGMSLTPIRRKLKKLRSVVIRGNESTNTNGATTVAGSKSESRKIGKSTKRDATMMPSGRITLHDEIVEILNERNEEWLTTKDIAELVNARGRYKKRDGSAVTAYQIARRTWNYSHLFDIDGSRVRLKERRSD